MRIGGPSKAAALRNRCINIEGKMTDCFQHQCEPLLLTYSYIMGESVPVPSRLSFKKQ